MFSNFTFNGYPVVIITRKINGMYLERDKTLIAVENDENGLRIDQSIEEAKAIIQNDMMSEQIAKCPREGLTKISF